MNLVEGIRIGSLSLTTDHKTDTVEEELREPGLWRYGGCKRWSHMAKDKSNVKKAEKKVLGLSKVGLLGTFRKRRGHRSKAEK